MIYVQVIKKCAENSLRAREKIHRLLFSKLETRYKLMYNQLLFLQDESTKFKSVNTPLSEGLNICLWKSWMVNMLRPMFAGVAETYDLANKVLTFGFDSFWRKACAKESLAGNFVVDLCCGTGDLSLLLLPKIGSESCLIGLDFSKEMLGKAIRKKLSRGKTKRQTGNLKHGKSGKTAGSLSFIIADAASLPLRTESVDDIRISFSFRNLIYRNPKAITYLKEVVRTLKGSGHFTCVETSQPKNLVLRSLFHFYCLKFVPQAGLIISGRKSAYTYLGKSAANFPFPQEILAMLKKAGFKKTTFKPLSFGIVGLYSATKHPS